MTRLTNNADDGRKMMKLVVCSTRVSQIYGVREAEHQRVAQVSINCYKNLKLNVESKSAWVRFTPRSGRPIVFACAQASDVW